MSMTLHAELSADAPARVVRERYTIDAAEWLEFKSEARRAGLVIVRSAPIGGDRYAVTVQHA